MLNNHILDQQQKIINYLYSLGFPKDPLDESQTRLLLLAFVHKSYASDFVPALDHNERLEFLGDSILGACIGSSLYQSYPQRSEADMTLYKIALVREETLALVARNINLAHYLFVSKGEEKQGGLNKDSILADSLEALIGAGFLIYGFEKIQDFIFSTIRPELNHLVLTNCKSFKSLMQERAQAQGFPLPSYHTYQENNESEIIFSTQLRINDKLYGTGLGKNKKKSQEEAARNAYETLGLV